MISDGSAPSTDGANSLQMKIDVQGPKTGGIVLSGDLYHYPEERTLNRVPNFEFNQEQTCATRVSIDAFLKKTSAQLWIQHDFTSNARLKKARTTTSRLRFGLNVLISRAA